MSDFPHPIWPASPEGTSRTQGRSIDQLERRKHGPWHYAGAPIQGGGTEPSCNLTPDPNYFGGFGVRWRRQVGGGTLVEVAVTDGVLGQVVLTLLPNWYVFGEDRIPLTGHNAGGAAAFYIDTSNGNIVVGV